MNTLGLQEDFSNKYFNHEEIPYQKRIWFHFVFPFLQLEDDGKLFYTLDDGQTRFTDLIQLVEFYQLNKGVLPCKLKHYCARIPL